MSSLYLTADWLIVCLLTADWLIAADVMSYRQHHQTLLAETLTS